MIQLKIIWHTKKHENVLKGKDDQYSSPCDSTDIAIKNKDFKAAIIKLVNKVKAFTLGVNKKIENLRKIEIIEKDKMEIIKL